MTHEQIIESFIELLDFAKPEIYNEQSKDYIREHFMDIEFHDEHLSQVHNAFKLAVKDKEFLKFLTDFGLFDWK